MYETNLVDLDNGSKNLETAWQAAKKLSTDEKAELVEKLLDQESELIVVPANGHLIDYIIAQMHFLSIEGLTYVLKATSSLIASDCLNSKS
ncbi:MAG: hypothetical protein WBG73_06635 [Coleofasciculaceae cyanobacterium]